MYKLLIEDDEGKTTVVPLIRDEITIGRKEGNTIRLTERNVSRRHAKLSKLNGSVYIEDCGSYNGIRVNGARIQGRVSIGEGDRIQIGDYLLALRLDRPSSEGRDPFSDVRTQPIDRTEDDKTERDTRPMQAAPPLPGATPAPRNEWRDAHHDTIRMQTVPAATLDLPRSGGGGSSDFGSDDITRFPGDVGLGGPTSSAEPRVSYKPEASADGVAAAVARPARMVVVSANFAGQEFLIDKPTVVVGRTEENDIVLNHRSISRHHAKIVREHGRYNIVDLQSANGVRVNGEPYGKVELRRGDLIDLGHVRLRFVESGEDFVFDRDAEIYDLGERRGMRGVVIGGLAAVALAAVGFLFRDRLGFGGEPGATPPPDAAVAVVEPVRPDAAGVRVSPLDASAAPAPGVDAWSRMRAAVQRKDWDAAVAAFEEIPEDSPLRVQARPVFEEARTAYVKVHLGRAQDLQAAGRCAAASKEAKSVLVLDEANDDANQIVRDCAAGGPPAPAPREPKPPAIKNGTPAPEPAPERQPPPERAEKPEKAPAPAPAPAPAEAIDPEELARQAQDAYNRGQHAQAIALAKRALKAKPNHTAAINTVAAAMCKLRDKDVLRWYGRLEAKHKPLIKMLCHNEGVELP